MIRIPKRIVVEYKGNRNAVVNYPKTISSFTLMFLYIEFTAHNNYCWLIFTWFTKAYRIINIIITFLVFVLFLFYIYFINVGFILHNEKIN